MSYIREIEECDAEGEVAAVYEQIRQKRGRVAHILKAQSLRPSALGRHLDLYLDLMFGPGKLSRAHREMIAVVVSSANRCAYCVSHHRETLKRYVHEAEALDDLEGDLDNTKIPVPTRALLAYAKKLTIAPGGILREDVEGLRRSGYSDEEILHANLIGAYFNFVNRIALGLGVEHSDDEITGYKG